MNNIHDWIFHKNCYTNKWCAVKRDNYNLLFSNYNSPLVLKSSSIKTLEDLINKTDGDEKAISKLITK